jgi:sugar lactone lactonase YvrE
MCAFGGAWLDTLFVTSIRPGGTDSSDQPLAALDLSPTSRAA